MLEGAANRQYLSIAESADGGSGSPKGHGSHGSVSGHGRHRSQRRAFATLSVTLGDICLQVGPLRVASFVDVLLRGLYTGVVRGRSVVYWPCN